MQMQNCIEILLGEWSRQPGHMGAILLRVGLVLLFSAIIGLERSSKRQTAGLRTFMLVGLASVFAALCDEFMISSMGMDMAFLSAADLICISSIGGKTLLFTSKNKLKGLTTAVCLITDAVLSLCIGLGMYTYALVGFIAAIACMALLPFMESALKGISHQFEIHLELKSRNMLQDFIKSIREFGLHLDDIEFNPAYANTGLGVYTMKLTAVSGRPLKSGHGSIIEALAALDCVEFVEEIK